MVLEAGVEDEVRTLKVPSSRSPFSYSARAARCFLLTIQATISAVPVSGVANQSFWSMPKLDLYAINHNFCGINFGIAIVGSPHIPMTAFFTSIR